MMVVWIVLELMFISIFYHLPSAIENEEESVENDSTSKCSSSEIRKEGESMAMQELNSYTYSEKCSSTSDREEEVKKDASISASASVVEKVSEGLSECRSRLQKAQQYVFFVASEMVKEEIVVLLTVMFMTVFSETAMEVGRNIR